MVARSAPHSGLAATDSIDKEKKVVLRASPPDVEV